MKSERATVYGDCGALVLSYDTNGPIILGIHTAINIDGTLVALRVTCEDIETMLGNFKVPMVQAGGVSLSSESAPQRLLDLNKKAEVRFIPRGNALVYVLLKDIGVNRNLMLFLVH